MCGCSAREKMAASAARLRRERALKSAGPGAQARAVLLPECSSGCPM